VTLANALALAVMVLIILTVAGAIAAHHRMSRRRGVLVNPCDFPPRREENGWKGWRLDGA
jgi:hypothetical protein